VKRKIIKIFFLKYLKAFEKSGAFFIPATFRIFEKIHYNEFQTNPINSWSTIFSNFLFSENELS